MNSTAFWLNPVSDILTKALKDSVVSVDKAQGIVECFVAAIGNKDSVGDIIVPGAFTKSLGRRKPRVVWGHNWNEPVGKVLEMFEVGPSDPRLPTKMRSMGVGGLFAKVQFNLASERGREAFATVAFFGDDQEWSIGYKTIDKEYDAIRQANLLKELELYEVSPVLHGANQLTGTIAVKDALDTSTDQSGCPVDILSNALSKSLDAPVRVQYIEDDTLVYQDEKQNHWASKFQIQNGRFVFGQPRRVVLRATIEPLEEEEGDGEVDPNCPCGRHLPPPGHPLYAQTQLPKLADRARRFGASEYREYAAQAPGKAFVLGRPPLLSGLTVKATVSTLDQVANIVGAMTGMLGTVALVVPSVKGLDSGLDRVIVYLPKTNNPELFVSYITETIKELGDIGVETKQLDAYTEGGKPFEEVFLK